MRHSKRKLKWGLVAIVLFSSYTNTVIAQDKNQKPSTLKLESNEDFLREELVGGPHEFELDFNLPDPFTTKTTLYFAIPNETNLELSIYLSLIHI